MARLDAPGIFGALGQLRLEHPETPESITATAISHAVEARISQASFASSSEKRRKPAAGDFHVARRGAGLLDLFPEDRWFVSRTKAHEKPRAWAAIIGEPPKGSTAVSGKNASERKRVLRDPPHLHSLGSQEFDSMLFT
ncbi:MAG: hypothetical protein IIA67_02835 [Planctomycetes bacterium]|nr:hypothetical protein [Planctomycetota bacterium]